MNIMLPDPTQPRVYTTQDGRAAIQQSTTAVVLLSAEQILTVINELRECYDYCAAWKDEASPQDGLRQDEP